MSVGSISVDLSCQVYPSREEPSGGGEGGGGEERGPISRTAGGNRA